MATNPSRPHVSFGARLVVSVLFILMVVGLIYVLVQWAARAFGYRRARGRSFRALAHHGAVSGELAEAADRVIIERHERRHARRTKDPAYAQIKTRPKPKLSSEQVKALKVARARVRDDYLEHVRPGFYHYVIIFVVASVLGLVLEMVWMLVSSGRTELRVGLVWGPFSPLYGFGACLLTLVLWNFREAGSVQVFLVSAALGGGLEQVTGLLMERLFHAQSWTYLGLPDAITQWVAWRFLVAWGLIGLLWCRVIMPEMVWRIGEPTTRMQAVLVTILTVFLVVDMLATVWCFWRKAERDAGVPASNAIDEYVDSHFSDEFIAGRFQNLVVGEDLAPNA